jgi:hypothetical protein
MFLPTTPEETQEPPTPSSKRAVILEPNFDQPLKPIAELAAREDFPDCTVGEFVDIGGFTGVVVEIVNQSLKLRSPDHLNRSFKVYTLRKLYGPAHHPEAVDTTRQPEPVAAHWSHENQTTTEPVVEEPEPVIEKPVLPAANFEGPCKHISEFVGRADFPECAFGEFIDIGGFRGGIVEVVKGSIKVRSPEETTRSYNIQGLRKLFGQG